jgi:hypothetical protein
VPRHFTKYHGFTRTPSHAGGFLTPKCSSAVLIRPSLALKSQRQSIADATAGTSEEDKYDRAIDSQTPYFAVEQNGDRQRRYHSQRQRHRRVRCGIGKDLPEDRITDEQSEIVQTAEKGRLEERVIGEAEIDCHDDRQQGETEKADDPWRKKGKAFEKIARLASQKVCSVRGVTKSVYL